MNSIASMSFPVLAFTSKGILPYSRYENLLRVMKHEYEKGWFNNLEVVDSEGVCAVIKSAKIVKEPVLAKLFGRMIEVEIQESEKIADYDADAVRSRVLEFLWIYPDMYQSAGVYDDTVHRVNQARNTRQIVMALMD